MLEKLKSFLADDALYTALLVILVGVVAFGLGRQSVLGTSGAAASPPQTAAVTISETPPPVLEVPNEEVGVEVVASRSGSKYHLPNCPGAKQIKEANKITFANAALARAAGYTPAANCPALE